MNRRLTYEQLVMRTRLSAYLEKRKKLYEEEVMMFQPPPIYHITKMIDEEHMEIEETFCTHFGCGKPLSLVEKLAGEVCSKHMNNKPSIYHNGLL